MNVTLWPTLPSHRPENLSGNFRNLSVAFRRPCDTPERPTLQQGIVGNDDRSLPVHHYLQGLETTRVIKPHLLLIVHDSPEGASLKFRQRTN